jgi:hypothetical protein
VHRGLWRGTEVAVKRFLDQELSLHLMKEFTQAGLALFTRYFAIKTPDGRHQSTTLFTFFCSPGIQSQSCTRE